MRLSIVQRIRVIQIYEDNNLSDKRYKIAILKNLAEQEGIVISKKCLRELLNKVWMTGSVVNLNSGHSSYRSKETLPQPNQLETRVSADRGLTSEQLRDSIGIQASARTVRRYMNLLGWRSVRIKFCQYVTLKNRIERVVYASFCSKRELRRRS